jgi:hypothetical protein
VEVASTAPGRNTICTKDGISVTKELHPRTPADFDVSICIIAILEKVLLLLIVNTNHPQQKMA